MILVRDDLRYPSADTTSYLDIALSARAGHYSAFINALTKSGVLLDRKVLSDMAINDPASFTALVKQVGAPTAVAA